MALFDQFVKQGVQTPDTLGGSPAIASQSFIKAEVIYHMTSINLYLLYQLEGPDVTGGGILMGCAFI